MSAERFRFRTLRLTSVLAIVVLLLTASPLAPSAEAQAQAPFTCASDAGRLFWTNDGVAKYWLYRSTDDGATYNWMGRTIGDPAPTTFTDPYPMPGALYQVHYQGIARVDCTIVNEPAVARLPFGCTSNAGTLTWIDDNSDRYWVYKSTDGGETFDWLGRTIGDPAPTTLTDPNPRPGAQYQVQYPGIPRSNCVIASEPVLPTAVVTMGDSYISGEGGRWAGNANSTTGNSDGTDRAAQLVDGAWVRNVDSVYIDGTNQNGCHRSDVAPVLSTTLAVDARFNLACSGAETVHVRSAASGGQAFKGERPQADQLAALADTHDVQMIVLSIGGNDLGFGGIIADCAWRYLFRIWVGPCNEPQQASLDDQMATVMADVSATIDDIQATMAAAGNDDYRLVVQSYPSPLPRGSEFRYGESGQDRASVGRCPVRNVDATWARDEMVPQISASLAAVASAKGAEFLDLSDMMEGREICASTAALGSGSDAEWARFLTTNASQGELQESVHPNALGQRAMGSCIDLVWAASPGSFRCTNVAGAGPETMALS